MANWYGWYVGQKVVCITDDWESDPYYESGPAMSSPVKGRVYTIREIETFFENISFSLEEIINPIDEDGFEGVYECVGFRPVRTTDISIFTNMLKLLLEKVD